MPTKFAMRLLAGTAVSALLTGVSFAAEAEARPFDIPQQDAATALQAFAMQSGRQVLFPYEAARGKQAPEIKGDYSDEEVVALLAASAGLKVTADDGRTVTLRPQFAQAADAGGGSEVEALIVTAQKREEDIQDVPIAISAFTQEQLERSQVAGGPDLMTQVPNMTFTKTNFSSYSIQIRGIGTQAISATTDPAVAVAFNNTPFVRNRFFEQEFYDLQRIEVLRGPQGTLYGRNATAGVVNIISAKPKFDFEAKLSGDVSNYNSTRIEGMVNVPLVEDKVALRLAGAWTKRDGYVTNEITGTPIDGRDLWSTRVSLRVSPNERFDANLIWEHFEEDDDRLRSGKQLCHQDDRTEINGYEIPRIQGGSVYLNVFSQGCIPASLYSPDAFEAPDGFSLPYYHPLSILGLQTQPGFNPYASLVQSRDLRVIESTIDPEYTATSDLIELQWSLDLNDHLTLASETAYNYDEIFSLQDLNRFNTASGAFVADDGTIPHRPDVFVPGDNGAVFCDPQIGCADRVVAMDISTARSRQFSQEFRLSSDYDGPFNFSLGANFLRYDTEDKYYVFVNTLTAVAARASSYIPGVGNFGPYVPNVTDNHECVPANWPAPDPAKAQPVYGCVYIDPNPIGSLNDLGHNYFLSKNPYKLISYAVFGEAYYNVTENLKVTAGLRWTVDKKEAPLHPSWVLAANTIGYPVSQIIEQEWREPTGRLTVDWKPDFSFTDETLLYASFARGYKAGGANPPPAGTVTWAEGLGNTTIQLAATKPRIFDPEFVNAFEVGAKNTLLDGQVTLNLAGFYYDYSGYQVSQIIDRSATNYNFDSEVWGLELEADWRPLENLRFGLKLGYEDTKVADGEQAIDIMERNAGHGPDSDDPWIVVRPFPTYTSNCVVPLSIFQTTQPVLQLGPNLFQSGFPGPCEIAYLLSYDPVTSLPYVPNPTEYGNLGTPTGPLPSNFAGYPGWDPTLDYGNNKGEGFFKDLSGNELPNAPHFTATITADYTLPLPNDWLATLHTDLYYQSEAWTRIFNMEGYDKLKAYTNVNVAAIFTNEEAGWKVMAYVKNVMDRDSITGAFLFPDDVGLTTNVFLTEPRLYGLRVTKEWNGGPWWTGPNPDHTGPYPFTVELGGGLARHDAPYDPVQSAGPFSGAVDPATAQNRDLDLGQDGEVKLTYRPNGGSWHVAGGVRFGRVKGLDKINASQIGDGGCVFSPYFSCEGEGKYLNETNWIIGDVRNLDRHLFVDFEVGKELGIGGGLQAEVSGGLRYADIQSETQLSIFGIPDWDVPEYGVLYYPTTHHYYDTDLVAQRQFKGVGPVLSLDISKTLLGLGEDGRLDLDASLTGGVLFGKQKTSVGGTETTTYYSESVFKYPAVPDSEPTPTPRPAPRSKSATVPTFSASLGLSYEVQRFKVGAGYRWERYVDVLDAGYAEHKDYDRTIDGPYFKIAVGFGGG